jgi:hypothetical protein
VSSGSKVFDALLWRKSAQLAEAFIESDDPWSCSITKNCSVFSMRYIIPSMLSECEVETLISCVFRSALWSTGPDLRVMSFLVGAIVYVLALLALV